MVCEHHYCLKAIFEVPKGECGFAYRCCKCLTGDARYQILLAREKRQRYGVIDA